MFYIKGWDIMSKLNPELVAKVISDSYSLKILGAAYVKPRTIQSLALEYNIPIAAAYRRMKTLLKMGFLRCEKKILTKEGKRVGLYVSDVKSVHLTFQKGRLVVKVDTADSPEGETDVVNLLTT